MLVVLEKPKSLVVCSQQRWIGHPITSLTWWAVRVSISPPWD